MYTEIMHSTQLCFLLKPVNSRHKRDRLHFIIPTGGLQSLCRSRHFWRNMISPVKRSSRFAATAAAGSDRAWRPSQSWFLMPIWGKRCPSTIQAGLPWTAISAAGWMPTGYSVNKHLVSEVQQYIIPEVIPIDFYDETKISFDKLESFLSKRIYIRKKIV